MAADLTGLSVGNYVLRQRLASGGFGTVYRASDPLLGIDRAVKVLHAHVMEQKGFRERFLSELRITASLDHPNIVRVLSAFDEPQLCGYAMEYVPGPTLRRRLRESGRLDPAQALDIVAQTARAVQYSQSRRPPIIHRDLTPENILLRPDGVVKVMDYGIAAAIEDPALAVSKSIVGKPKYMPPEQFEGEVTTGVDIYALGVILYEALTGKPPFDGDSAMEIYRAHLTQAARPPSQIAPGIPAELDGFALRALAKDPAERFPDADRFLRALEYVAADFSGRPRAAGADVLALLRPPAALASARVPSPDEAAQVEALYSAGFSLLSNQRYADAVEKFDAALRLDPAHLETRRHRRIARVRQLEVSEVARDRTKQTQFEEDNLRLGLTHFNERRWEEAAATFERVLRLNPDRLEAKRYRYEAQERAAAEAVAMKVAREKAAAARTRGIAAFEAGRHGEASAAFLEALASDPTDAEARQYAERCGEALARAEVAGMAEASARGPAGESLEATRAGLVRFASGDLEGAMARFMEALRLDPAREEARTWLDRCRARLAEAAEARRAAERLEGRDEHEMPAPGRTPPAAEKQYSSEPSLPIVDLTAEMAARGATVTEPARAAAAVASAPAPATPLPAAAPARPAFVGRANTLQVMEKALEDAPRGKGAFLLVRGKPGAGKSRLMEEFASRNSYRNFHFIEARCTGDLGEYFAPWRTIALSALRAVEAVDFLAYTKLAMKFAPDFGRFGDAFRKLALSHNRNFDLTVTDARMRDLVVELLSAVLDLRPLFISLDAVELADSETLAVLERVATLTRERPLVLVAAASLSPAAETNPWARVYPRFRTSKLASEFLVPRLPDDDLRKMLGPLLARELKWNGSGEPPRAEARIATEVARVTEGDLNQVEKICRHLATAGLVAEDAGLWRLKKRGPLTEDDLVSGLGEVLWNRFRGLNARSSGLVRWLSISEDGLPFDVLSELAAIGQNDLFHATHELSAQKLVAEQDEKGKRAFLLVSPVFRSRVYGEIPLGDRQSMHDRCAAALERLDKSHPERAAAVALKGTTPERAVDCAHRAADAALETGRPAEARAWLEKAEPWLQRTRAKGQAVAQAERLGRALLASGQPDAALRAFQGVLSSTPPAERMPALRLDLARIYLLLGRRREAADALAMAGDKPKDKRDEVSSQLLLAKLAMMADDLATAGMRLESARHGADAAGLAGPALAGLAAFRFAKGELRQAEADATEALERGGAPEALLTLARCQLLQGRALTAAARVESALEGCGDRVLEAELRALLVQARTAAGRGTAAREQSALALQSCAHAGAPATTARAALAAAGADFAAEDYDAAREHAAAAQAAFDRCGSRSGLARAAIALGEAHSALGDPARASQYFDLAAASSNTPELAGLLPAARAENSLRAGRAAEARAHFHAALEHLGHKWPDAGLIGRVYSGLADCRAANGDREGALRNYARAVKTLRDSELALPFALVRASWAALLASSPGTRDEAREAAEIATEAASTLQAAGARTAEARAREVASKLRAMAE
ncbi:MAG: protein kinase [Planctomycetota bacterium]